MADYWSYHRNDEFRDKVKYEMQVAAVAVMAESAETAGHTERVAYAGEILGGTASVKEMCIGVLTNLTIKAQVTAGEDCTDNIAYAVSTLFNAFAGVAN